ncbi:DNA primase [Georgenia sp. Z1344]|uniref:DNA primase n=1 Tax=Georgenia sp. Z1344 TaxID=3416706 RepID=UPI003CF8F830
MAGMIRREDIEAVKEKVRIEEVVGAHVTLRTAGVGSMKGLCPFHDERTPSFHVRPQVGVWHCFGCGEGGDVVSFVQRIEGLSFAEAIEMLADRVGVELRREDEDGRPRERSQGEPGRRRRLVEANRIAAEYFVAQLASPGAAPARAFLAERGFDQAAAAHFGVGFAPEGWDHLLRHLRSKGLTDQEILAAGLVSQGQRGVYDRFRGRLVWPIRSTSGETLGFGARRLLESDQGPKYLNTPETPLYRKSHVLYGIDLARKEIGRGRQVVVVEGYTDVMAAHLAGVTTAVATCGTAFGDDHVRIVRRLLGDVGDAASGVMTAGSARGGEVVFTFDGDAAGQKAALRAFDEDQRFAAQTFVAVTPGGMDPCDLRLERGDAAVRDLVAGREPLFEFVIRSALATLDLGTAEGRVAGLRAAAPVVAAIRDRALRGEYARQLAGWLGMDDVSVRQAVRSAESSARRAGAPGGSSVPDAGGPGRAGGAPGETGRPGGQNGRPGGQPGGSGPSGGAWETSAGAGGGRGPEDPVARLERQVLEVALQLPAEAAAAGFDSLAADTFTVPSYRAAHDAIRAAGGVATFAAHLAERRRAGAGEEAAQREAAAHWVEAVRENAVGPVADSVTGMAVAPLPQDRPDALTDYARGVVVALVRMGLTRLIGDAKGTLQRTDPDDPAYAERFAALMELESRRRSLGSP